MIGKQDKQMQMIILDIDSMIPQDHLLRRIKKRLLMNALRSGESFLCLAIKISS